MSRTSCRDPVIATPAPCGGRETRPTRRRGAALLTGLALAAVATPAAAHHCRNVLPDGRIVVAGPLVDELGRPCTVFHNTPLAPHPEFVVPRQQPRAGFTTGEIGPFTTGDLGPFTTFSNSNAAPAPMRRR